MKKVTLAMLIGSCITPVSSSFADTQVEQLQQQLNQLKQDYETRIKALEMGLKAAQIAAQKQEEEELASDDNNLQVINKNAFNPQISLILNGTYSDYQQNPDNYFIQGFPLGSEASLATKGFSLGESEITLSANIDQAFYGQLTLAFSDDGVGVEEAFAQTTALANGLTLKMGRFFSGLGYLNGQHAHAWDFADAPLIYRVLFGDQYGDDGLQISYIAPTDLFLEFGAEWFAGSSFPASGTHSGIGSWTGFTKIGGDFYQNHSWQLGLSHWQGKVATRENTGRALGFIFDGKDKINALDFVYKWSPNQSQQRFKLQFEYFDRNEQGIINKNSIDFTPPAIAPLSGHQKGWYAQTIYHFNRQWRVGLRYDQLASQLRRPANISEFNIFAPRNLISNGYHPKRYSTILEWHASEFSRIRLQYNHDQSNPQSDNQLFLQYTFSLGTHGAHSY